MLGAAVGTTTPAVAGTYTVWYCQDSADRGISGAERDWSHAFGGADYASEVIVTCPGNLDQPSGAISTTVEANPNNSPDEVIDDAQMFAPAYVTLSHVNLWWNGFVNDGSQVAAIALTGGSVPVGGLYDGQVLADHRNNFGPASPIPGPPESYDVPANTTGLLLRSACLQGSGTCQTGTFAQFNASRVSVVASDASAPQGTATGGLVTDPVLAGQPTVTMDTIDKGAGVFVARILVDGQVRASTPFGDKLCRDIDTANGDPFEFSTISPCPLHDTASVQLDTSAIGDDAYHHVQVQVIDAAGNATTIADRTVGISRPTLPGFFDPASRHFLNPWLDLATARQLNGQGASSGAILRVYLPLRRTERFKHGRYKGQRRRVIRAAAHRTVRFASRPTLRASPDRRLAPADRQRQRMDCVARRGRGVADHGQAAHDGQDRACRTTAAGTHTLAPDQRRLLPVQRQPRAGSGTTGEAQGPRRSDPRGQPPQRTQRPTRALPRTRCRTDRARRGDREPASEARPPLSHVPGAPHHLDRRRTI